MSEDHADQPSKEPAPPSKESAPARPLDLGLAEGKSMAFAPTSALPPEGPPIGGLGPASPQNVAPADPPPPPPPDEGSES
ncbi:MAG TPA: hypothetical protein VG518_03520 [Solirubrobacterales bacterium]|nr:hypothetical protein [Solirubrobacterales bacterium]